MDDKRPKREYVKEQVVTTSLDKEIIWRLLAYLRPYRGWLIFGILSLIASKAIEVSVPIFIGQVSQEILDAARVDSDKQAIVFDTVLKTGFIILALLLISYLFESANVVIKSWIGQKAIYRLRLRVYQHILHMPLSYFDKHAVGRLMTRTIHDVDQINQLFAESVIPIFGNLVLFAGIFTGIFIINWKIGILTLAILPLVVILTTRFRIEQRKCYERIRTVVSAMNTFVQENLMGAATIRSFGLQKKLKMQFEEINDDHCSAYLDSVRHFSFFISGIDFLQSFSLIMAFAILVIWSPLTRGFDVGEFFAFSLYAMMMFRPLVDLAERYNILQSAMAASNRIFNVIDQFSEKSQDTGKLTLKEIESISFENVWFAYDEKKWVLRDVSFSIQKGESVAFVGMTGEGKSTMISLLLRFYPCSRGEIKINGRNITDYTLASLRQHFSLVLQDPVVFSGTVAENISLFDKKIEKNQMMRAIGYLGLEGFIERLPNGLDHHLSERGKSLSTGELQLVSMARAVANQRQVLILDEATANIDTGTEKIIQEGLQRIMREKTALVIAHRLSTIKDAGTILVLHQGQIVEKGTHRELLKLDGVYEKLYRFQFEK